MNASRRIERPGVRAGYDLWAETYDVTPNPVVALDERATLALAAPRAGERVLDAGCGTGRHLGRLLAAGCDVTGMDFSLGMLRVAARNHPQVPLLQADLERDWPFHSGSFDLALCALVGEHLTRLDGVFGEMRRVLAPGGRAVFSVYHPAMAEAGKEANFQRDETEYRLGAVRHTLADYRSAFEQAGFSATALHEYSGDDELVAYLPAARRYLGFPLLIVLTGSAP